MRFTNGYWMTKQEYIMNCATQCVRVTRGADSMQVLAACRPIRGRGDILNSGNLTVTFSAPRKNVIRVQVTHFAGVALKEPRFEINEEPVQPVMAEDGEYASFTSGSLTARVHKGEGSWQVDYVADGRVLTSSSGFRGMCHALKKEEGPCSLYPHGQGYMMDSLMLDVGECVYGLGERFGAYVKNGQTVDMWNADGGTASELAYKNVPFYMTNRGYGILVEDTSDVSFEVASEKVERVQFSVEG